MENAVVRRLQAADAELFRAYSLEEAAFDVADREREAGPLSLEGARAYLANPAVLHWVALEGDVVVGELQCVIIPLPDERVQELVLYDVGVRASARRRGIGRALLSTMEAWMRGHGVSEVWVLADNAGAVEFYRDGGFEAAGEQPVYMTRSLSLR